MFLDGPAYGERTVFALSVQSLTEEDYTCSAPQRSALICASRGHLHFLHLKLLYLHTCSTLSTP